MAAYVAPLVAAAVVLYLVLTYNALIQMRNRVSNAWSQVDVLLQRRHNLVPNLVSSVRGYMAHEQQALDALTRARAEAAMGGGPARQAAPEAALTAALGQVLAVAESYPQLKADTAFRALQDELRETENKIAYFRQFYNDTVLIFNTRAQAFPSNLVAGLFRLQPAPFFAEGREAVR